MEVLEVVDVGHDPPGGRVVPQIVEHPIHLVHVPLGVVVLHPQLVAVGLADGAVRVRPLVPDAGVQVVDVVGLLLPDPEQLLHRRLPIGPAEGEEGELLSQVIAVHQAEGLYRMGGTAVLPPGADLPVRVPDAVGENFPAVLHKQQVGTTHGQPPLIAVYSKSSTHTIANFKEVVCPNFSAPGAEFLPLSPKIIEIFSKVCWLFGLPGGPKCAKMRARGREEGTPWPSEKTRISGAI